MLLKFPNSQYLFPCKVGRPIGPKQGFNLRFIFVYMQIFLIRSLYVDMHGYVHLNPFSDLFLHSKARYSVILPAMHQSPWKQYGSTDHVTCFFRERSWRNSLIKGLYTRAKLCIEVISSVDCHSKFSSFG